VNIELEVDDEVEKLSTNMPNLYRESNFWAKNTKLLLKNVGVTL
jgi:hypothetical protein